MSTKKLSKKVNHDNHFWFDPETLSHNWNHIEIPELKGRRKVVMACSQIAERKRMAKPAFPINSPLP